MEGWASDFALQYSGQDTEDLAESETDRDMDPETWDIDEEFRTADGTPTSDASIPFCVRARHVPPARQPLPIMSRQAAPPPSRRQAWRDLFRGILGLTLSVGTLVYGAMQIAFAILACAFIVLCLILLSKCS